MAKLLLHLDPAQPAAFQQALASATGSEIVAAEVDGTALYLAARRGSLTTALISHLTPLATPLASGENVALTLEGEAANPALARATRTVTDRLTPLGPLLDLDPRWRERCHAWQKRLALAARGERLLGESPDADGSVSYNPVGKAAFERDARRFLNALLGHLGWSGKVHDNRAGIACSGEVSIHAAPKGSDPGVYVEVSAGGGWNPVQTSPSGVVILWRLEGLAGQDRWQPAYANQWASWTVTASALAARIQAAHVRTQPQPQANAAD
jgi:hypothetical protein